MSTIPYHHLYDIHILSLFLAVLSTFLTLVFSFLRACDVLSLILATLRSFYPLELGH